MKHMGCSGVESHVIMIILGFYHILSLWDYMILYDDMGLHWDYTDGMLRWDYIGIILMESLMEYVHPYRWIQTPKLRSIDRFQLRCLDP